MESPSLGTDPRFATNAGRLANRAELETIIEERFRAITRADVIDASSAQISRRAPSTMYLTWWRTRSSARAGDGAR